MLYAIWSKTCRLKKKPQKHKNEKNAQNSTKSTKPQKVIKDKKIDAN